MDPKSKGAPIGPHALLILLILALGNQRARVVSEYIRQQAYRLRSLRHFLILVEAHLILILAFVRQCRSTTIPRRERAQII
jgi:hypothetical protein